MIHSVGIIAIVSLSHIPTRIVSEKILKKKF